MARRARYFSHRLLPVAMLSGGFLGMAAGAADASAEPGAVYAISNDPAGNALLVFDRASDGSLTPSASVPTGGLG